MSTATVFNEMTVAPEKIETCYVEDGFTFDVRYYPIIPGVEIRTYGDDEASLEIAGTYIPFALNAETRPIIENIDEFEAVELLALLQAHKTDY